MLSVLQRAPEPTIIKVVAHNAIDDREAEVIYQDDGKGDRRAKRRVSDVVGFLWGEWQRMSASEALAWAAKLAAHTDEERRIKEDGAACPECYITPRMTGGNREEFFGERNCRICRGTGRAK